MGHYQRVPPQFIGNNQISSAGTHTNKLCTSNPKVVKVPIFLQSVMIQGTMKLSWSGNQIIKKIQSSEQRSLPNKVKN